MNFVKNNVYHIYNRGNNKQSIFFKERNYIYFLNKVRKHIFPHCDILAYVLMPNHFHFLIHANERTELKEENKAIPVNVLSEGFRSLLSSYSRAINKQENRTGNLIQQNTKSKCVLDIGSTEGNYAEVCFSYIHQNPVRAGLSDKEENWHYSSYRDYAGFRNGTLCNKDLTNKLLGLNIGNVRENKTFNDESLKNIW